VSAGPSFYRFLSFFLLSETANFLLLLTPLNRKPDQIRSPKTGHRSPEGEYMYSSTLSLTSALDRGAWSTPRPCRFTPAMYIGGWIGPRAGLDVRKISPPPRFDPRTAQLVASRYNDYAIPAHKPNQECTNFPKIWEPLQNCRRQNRDMKQVSH
jgi:hypothetical protein